MDGHRRAVVVLAALEAEAKAAAEKAADGVDPWADTVRAGIQAPPM